MPISETSKRKLAAAAKRRKARPRRGRLPDLPSEEDLDPLASVAFGSPGALSEAEAAGLTWADFASSGLTPSGSMGYLIEDVRAIVEGKNETREEER